MGPRLWLLAPAAVLYTVDVGLTLAGQPPSYWAGDYGSAVEANPVAYALLALGPGPFAGLAVAWLAGVSALVAGWRHRLTGWVAVVVAVAHAVGGASWLTRAGPWGLAAAGAYLAAAAQVSGWCWRRYARCFARAPNRALQQTGAACPVSVTGRSLGGPGC